MISFVNRIGSRENSRRLCSLLIAAAIGALSAGNALAQYTSGVGADGITAAGSGEVELEPKRLRLNMWIEAKGKNAKSAAKALASHQERVREDLLAMNAKADTIRFSSTRFKSGQSEEQNAMQMMQLQMESSPIGLDEQNALPEIVTARSALQVDWELPTTDSLALAILPEGLKEQIAKRDLAGKENQPDLPDEQLERLEEMAAMMDEAVSSYGYGGSSDASEPQIVYVAETDPEQRRTAIKGAFDQARQSAELIASATGTELGALKSIVINQQQSEMMQAIRYATYSGSDEQPFATASPGEVTSPTLDDLSLRISLVAVFEM